VVDTVTIAVHEIVIASLTAMPPPLMYEFVLYDGRSTLPEEEASSKVKVVGTVALTEVTNPATEYEA
jgi:antitoxin (DNA-binding transcriptional repressor) of toxin-antitoxin stability system